MSDKGHIHQHIHQHQKLADIGRHCTEEKLRQELAEKGRERMEKFFDWKIAASAYIEVFKKII